MKPRHTWRAIQTLCTTLGHHPLTDLESFCLGDGPIKKFNSSEKSILYYTAELTTQSPSTYDVSLVPDLGFSLFYFHVVQ